MKNNYNPNKILFGISLAAIILGGSVPFSLGDTPDSVLSPQKQLKSGVLPEDITCRDNLVLVFRTNGSPACVSEKTSVKLGWNVIKSIPSQKSSIINSKTSIDNYNKDYLQNLETLSYETGDENVSSAPSVYSPGWSTAKISKIPKLGDVFEITVTAQADPPILQNHYVSIFVSHEFEFVEESLPENTETIIQDNRIYVNYKTSKVETGSLSVQVRTIDEGYGVVWGGSNYDIFDERFLIYVDKDNSFYYNDGDEPTVNQPPRPDYGITWADTVMLTQQNSGAASPSSSNGTDQIIPEYTSQQVEELGLSRINWDDHIDDKSFYGVMPQAENIKTTVISPASIPVGSTGIVKVTLESINRLNDYEHVLVDVKHGPGIELDAQKIDDPNCIGCEKYNIYNNDIFAIGLNNSTTIDYPIKATKAGIWMLNFVVNGEFERHNIVVE